jgi:PAS domain S-box-containing protein
VNSLRQKLGFSYGILIVMILAVSGWGLYHFARLGSAIDVILINNYKSILAAEGMKDALEGLDSSALFLIAGNPGMAREQFAASKEQFDPHFRVAANNITEAGEPEIIADIDRRYSAHIVAVDSFLHSGTPPFERSDDYFERLQPSFIGLKNRVDDLHRLNQDSIVAAHASAKSESSRAQLSTIIVALIGVVLSALFAWRFTAYLVDPISRLTDRAKQIGEGNLEQQIEIPSRDEIGVLAAEFNRMAARLRDLRKSEYWRLLREQKKSDAVIDSIDDPVIVTDASGAVTKINKSAAQLFGVSPDSASGGGDGEMPDSRAIERFLAAVGRTVAMQRPVNSANEPAVVPVKVGAAERAYRVRTKPIRDTDGRLIGAVTLLEDTTERREVDRLKDEFIAVAAAKMRRPLHSLRLALHAIVEGPAGDLTDKQAELLEAARQDAGQLDELFGDMLDLAEVEAGTRPLSLESVRPAEFVRSALDRHRSSAEAKHVELISHVWSDTPSVLVDKQAIRTVMDNLLTNAIRHTGRDGKVSIESWERHNFVFLSVRDTGEGIPADILPDIFARFVHIEGVPGGGTGLGLALVKRLVEAQGGQVSVESRIGEGATFTVALPKPKVHN